MTFSIIVFCISFVIVNAILQEVVVSHLRAKEAEEEKRSLEKCTTYGKSSSTRDDSYGGLG